MTVIRRQGLVGLVLTLFLDCAALVFAQQGMGINGNPEQVGPRLQELTQLLTSVDFKEVERAANELRKMGATARPATSDLLEAALFAKRVRPGTPESTSAERAALQAYIEIRPDSLQSLIESFERSDDSLKSFLLINVFGPLHKDGNLDVDVERHVTSNLNGKSHRLRLAAIVTAAMYDMAQFRETLLQLVEDPAEANDIRAADDSKRNCQPPREDSSPSQRTPARRRFCARVASTAPDSSAFRHRQTRAFYPRLFQTVLSLSPSDMRF
jgi:hypothetical protein